MHAHYLSGSAAMLRLTRLTCTLGLLPRGYLHFN